MDYGGFQEGMKFIPHHACWEDLKPPAELQCTSVMAKQHCVH